MKLFRSFPIYKQSETKDCGPACLKIICAHYGSQASIREIKDLCRIEDSGVSIQSLGQAAVALGFMTEAVKFTSAANQLPEIPGIEELPLPFIAHWDANHFVVVYKVSSDGIYISDPARGRARLSKKDAMQYLLREGKGKAILLEPQAQFFESKYLSKKNAFTNWPKLDFLLGQLKREKYRLLILLLFVFIQLLTQAVSPFLTRYSFDSGILAKDSSVLYTIILIQLFLFLFTAAINFYQAILSNKIAEHINKNLVKDFIQKVFRIQVRRNEQKKTSEFLQGISDLNRIESFLTYTFSNIFISTIGLIILGIISITFDPVAVLIFFAYNSLSVLWTIYVIRKKKELDYKNHSISITRFRQLSEFIRGLWDIKIARYETQAIKSFTSNQSAYFANNLAQIRLSQSVIIGGGLIKKIGYAFVTLFTGISTIKGEYSVGQMAAIQLIIGQLDAMLSNAVSSITTSQEVGFSIERIKEFQDAGEEQQGDIPLASIQHMQLQQLTFGYNQEAILHKLSIDVEKGTSLGIVGSSGSGKTTLLKLMIGMLSPAKGKVLVNGEELEAINKDEWRKSCGVVMQDSFLFTDTIENNICMGVNRDIDDSAKLEQVLRDVRLYDFVQTLPGKEKTIIGSEGVNLSSGQKQRVLIARLLFKRPALVFMDEATNSLDSETEKFVMDRLKTSLSNSTKIIAAHRLNTIKDADRIILLEKGEIAEIGDHQSLIHKKGKYYQLVKEQLIA